MSKFQRDYDRERFQGVKSLTSDAWAFSGPVLKPIIVILVILWFLSRLW